MPVRVKRFSRNKIDPLPPVTENVLEPEQEPEDNAIEHGNDDGFGDDVFLKELLNIQEGGDTETTPPPDDDFIIPKKEEEIRFDPLLTAMIEENFVAPAPKKSGRRGGGGGGGHKNPPILGLNRRVLLEKITQMKTLFPAELKQFRSIKPTASEEELQEILDEMNNIVSINTLDEFLTDSVLRCIQVVEGVSANYERYDISGCTDALKSNKEFHKLCKLCWVKYGSFLKLPPEYQLLMIVSTTAYMCNMKNRQKRELKAFLNSPVN